MRKYAAALALASCVAVRVVPSQDRVCLHGAGETSEQAARRKAAIAFARLINTTEIAAHRQAQAYYALGDLHTIPAAPEGFKAQLSSDGVSYTFSLKDTKDACQFALFSDQDGVIYTGVPLQ